MQIVEYSGQGIVKFISFLAALLVLIVNYPPILCFNDFTNSFLVNDNMIHTVFSIFIYLP
jgi:hypothetical protein